MPAVLTQPPARREPLATVSPRSPLLPACSGIGAGLRRRAMPRRTMRQASPVPRQHRISAIRGIRRSSPRESEIHRRRFRKKLGHRRHSASRSRFVRRDRDEKNFARIEVGDRAAHEKLVGKKIFITHLPPRRRGLRSSRSAPAAPLSAAEPYGAPLRSVQQPAASHFEWLRQCRTSPCKRRLLVAKDDIVVAELACRRQHIQRRQTPPTRRIRRVRGTARTGSSPTKIATAIS